MRNHDKKKKNKKKQKNTKYKYKLFVNPLNPTKGGGCYCAVHYCKFLK